MIATERGGLAACSGKEILDKVEDTQQEVFNLEDKQHRPTTKTGSELNLMTGESQPSRSRKGGHDPFTRGRTQDDVDEERIRTRVAAALADAGMDIRKVGQEVLFWLPAEFSRKYRELSEAALDYGGSGSHSSGGSGAGGSGGKAPGTPKGDYGRGTRRLGEGEGLKAHGGGKRWREGKIPIRNERALEIKRRLDRRLVRVIEIVSDELRAEETGKDVPDRCIECGRLKPRRKRQG